MQQGAGYKLKVHAAPGAKLALRRGMGMLEKGRKRRSAGEIPRGIIPPAIAPGAEAGGKGELRQGQGRPTWRSCIAQSNFTNND